MTALELLCKIQFVPRAETTKTGPVSVGERRRMLDNRAVSINGKRLTSKEEVTFPIFEVTFFPKSKAKCSLYYMPPAQAWMEYWEREDLAWAKSLLKNKGETYADVKEAKT